MSAAKVYVVAQAAPVVVARLPRCGHTATQHAAMVRVLLARRQPALSAALGKAASGWRDDEGVSRS